MIEAKWDHSKKPSEFVVTRDGILVHRGPYMEGASKYRALTSGEVLAETEKQLEAWRALATDMARVLGVLGFAPIDHWSPPEEIGGLLATFEGLCGK